MVDFDTQTCIDTVISQKVQAGELFTAFDISNAVKVMLRNLGTFNGSIHRHKVMRDDVNLALNYVMGDFNRFNYIRTLCDVSSTEKAFVYHPANVSASTYVGAGIANPVPVSPYVDPTAINAQVATTSVVNNSTSDVKMPDARGTLCVPSQLLKDAGFSTYGAAYVYKQVDCLLISPNVLPAVSNYDAYYTVDHSSNVRITKYTLEKCGLISTKGFICELCSNGVVVKKA